MMLNRHLSVEEFRRLREYWPSNAAMAKDLGVARQMVHYWYHGKKGMKPEKTAALFDLAEEKEKARRDG